METNNQNNWPTPNTPGSQGVNNIPPWIWSLLSMANPNNGNNMSNGQNNNQQTQQPTSGSVTTGLPGKLVNSQEDIRPNDIPNDGSIAYFPSMDQREIYARYWDKDCNLKLIKYIQEPLDEVKSKPDPFEVISDRLSKIEELLASRPQFSQNRQPQRNNNNNTQKGGSES